MRRREGGRAPPVGPNWDIANVPWVQFRATGGVRSGHCFLAAMKGTGAPLLRARRLCCEPRPLGTVDLSDDDASSAPIELAVRDGRRRNPPPPQCGRIRATPRLHSLGRRDKRPPVRGRAGRLRVGRGGVAARRREDAAKDPRIDRAAFPTPCREPDRLAGRHAAVDGGLLPGFVGCAPATHRSWCGKQASSGLSSSS